MRKQKKDKTLEEVAAIIRGDQPKRRKKPRGADCQREHGIFAATLPKRPSKKQTL